LTKELRVGQIGEGVHGLLEGVHSLGKGCVSGFHQVLGGSEGTFMKSAISGGEIGLSRLALQIG